MGKRKPTDGVGCLEFVVKIDQMLNAQIFISVVTILVNIATWFTF